MQLFGLINTSCKRNRRITGTYRKDRRETQAARKELKNIKWNQLPSLTQHTGLGNCRWSEYLINQKLFISPKVKKVIQIKIICLIFGNFLNQCQVHISRKAGAIHKSGEEEGGGLLLYFCSYIWRKTLNSNLVSACFKAGTAPWGPFLLWGYTHITDIWGCAALW